MYICTMNNHKEEIFGKKDYVWLEPEGLTQGVSLPDAYLLILREKEEGLHLPLLLGREGFDLLVRATKRHEFPATHLMGELARTFGIRLSHVLIRRAGSGRFFTTLCLEQEADGITTMRRLDMELAAGIAAALEAKRPIGIDSQDFMRLYTRRHAAGQVAVPIASMGDDLLREALKQAVENDNFELASQLRDELRSRDGLSPTAPQKDGTGNP